MLEQQQFLKLILSYFVPSLSLCYVKISFIIKCAGRNCNRVGLMREPECEAQTIVVTNNMDSGVKACGADNFYNCF